MAGALEFLALIVLATGWFVYVSVKNYREGRSAQRELPDVVREFMQRHGRSGGPPGEEEGE